MIFLMIDSKNLLFFVIIIKIYTIDLRFQKINVFLIFKIIRIVLKLLEI